MPLFTSSRHLNHALQFKITGARLRITGEPQRKNVETLLSTTPTITSRDPNKKAKCSCDRGYTDEEFLGNQNLDPYDAAAINNEAARNPFLSTEQYLDWLDGCRGKKHFQVFDPIDTSKARPLKDENGKNQLDANKIKASMFSEIGC